MELSSIMMLGGVSILIAIIVVFALDYIPGYKNLVARVFKTQEGADNFLAVEVGIIFVLVILSLHKFGRYLNL